MAQCGLVLRAKLVDRCAQERDRERAREREREREWESERARMKSAVSLLPAYQYGNSNRFGSMAFGTVHFVGLLQKFPMARSVAFICT